jgi:hypothetical protein
MATTTSPQTTPQPTSATPIRPTTWLDAAIAVLTATGRPMRPPEIVATARQWRWVPTSTTRTPAQSVGRDLRLAAQRGTSGLTTGPKKGQFQRLEPTRGPRPTTTTPWLPSAPLIRLIEATGGLPACGLGRHPGDPIEHTRLIGRLERAYQRARSGMVSVPAADELSVRVLGRHPCEVFGALWWDADAINEDTSPAGPVPRAG